MFKIAFTVILVVNEKNNTFHKTILVATILIDTTKRKTLIENVKV
jgi:hypothetical protein